MKRLRWQFVHGPGWLSKAIAYRSDGLSHVDVFTPAGMLRGAQGHQIGEVPAGYYDRKPFYEPFTRRLVIELEVTAQQWADYWAFSDKQLRKPYDHRGTWSFLTGRYAPDRNWRADRVWFCSEEVAANCEAAQLIGAPEDDYRLYEGVNHVEPGDMALLLQGAGARVLCDLHGIAASRRYALGDGSFI